MPKKSQKMLSFYCIHGFVVTPSTTLLLIFQNHPYNRMKEYYRKQYLKKFIFFSKAALTFIAIWARFIGTYVHFFT